MYLVLRRTSGASGNSTCVNDGEQKLAMKEMKDEPDTCNWLLRRTSCASGNSTCVNDEMSMKLAMT